MDADRVLFLAACAAAATLGCATSASADPVKWVLPQTGLWSEPARWSTNSVPNGPDADVTIDATGANYQVGILGSYTVNRFVLDSPTATFNGSSSATLTASEVDVRQGTFVVRGLSGARVSVSPGATFNLNNNPSLNNVTFAGDVTVSNGINANVTGSLGVEAGGSLHLNANAIGQVIFFRFYSPGQLTGGGDFVFDGTGYSYLAPGLVAGSSLTVGPNVTVRTGSGSGLLGTGRDRPITNLGTVRAQTAGQSVTVVATDFTNHGTLAATAGGSAIVRADTFTNDGTISATGAGSVADLDALTNAAPGVLSAGAGGTILLNGGLSNAGTINVSAGTLSLGGTWSNTGTITAAAGSTVTLGGQSTGVGSVSLSGGSSAAVKGTFTTPQLRSITLDNSTLTLASGGQVTNTGETLTFGPAFPLRIAGGRITGGTVAAAAGFEPVVPTGASPFELDGATLATTLTLQPGTTTSLTGAWRNQGTVVVNDGSTLVLGGTVATADVGSLVPALGGGTVRLAAAVNNTNATFDFVSAGAWQLSGASITGGTLTAPGTTGALIVTAGTSTLDGTVLRVANTTVASGGTLSVKNGLTFAPGAGNASPVVRLDTGASAGNLSFVGTQSLNGTGTVEFDGLTATAGTLRPSGAGTVLTLGPGVTVQTGSGNGAVGAAGLTTVNQGVISARTLGKTVTLDGVITNQGTIEARDGGTVTFGSGASLTNLSAGALTGGTWRAYAGSTLAFPAGASVTTNGGDVVVSGLTSRFAALDALAANAGSLTLAEGRDFRTAGGLSNSGQLTLGAGSDLVATAGLTLAGDASTIRFELKSAASPEGYGQASVTGTASLDGALAILLAADPAVHVGDDFTLATADAFSGAFDSILLPPGLNGTLSFVGNQMQFHVTAVPSLVPEPTGVALCMLAGTAAGLRRRRRPR